MAIGVYPVPNPDAETVEQILGDNPNAVINEPKNWGIFQVLEHIVKEPPPKLEHSSFSTEFRDFLDKCLIKSPELRATPETLLVSH